MTSEQTEFIERHGLWTEEQKEAAEQVKNEVEKHELEVIRLSWPDQHGLLRGKFLSKDTFLSALESGLEITMGPFFFDTANDIVFNPFIAGGGFEMPELSGSPNVRMVPDPLTFRILPWAPKTGWLLADLYFRDGRPFPFAPRSILKAALDELRDKGYEFVAGLEVEWHLTRIVDPMLEPEHLGAPGNPAEPPRVMPVAHGYSYLLENHLDEIDTVLQPLRSALLDLEMPLRTIDDEWGPSQVETIFDVMPALEAADAMVLFRSATKQICRRQGYLATFMCQPAIAGFYASGWHLHSSLAHTETGENLFTPQGQGEPLSQIGKHYVAGILDHASASSVFTTPTISGYRRVKPFSLAPDRVTWGFDNRGAMIRVISSPGDPSSHVENRAGEPAANPYLYIASQVVAGLDGIYNRTEPPPIADEPYAQTDQPVLPPTLQQALAVLKQDTFFREKFGDRFVDYLIRIKENEWNRFAQSLEGQESALEEKVPDQVTAWEHKEYFELF